MTDEGGATPAGRPAPRGAGARRRESEGVAPPSPVTPLLTPDAAKSAASPSTSPRRNVIASQGLCGGASSALFFCETRKWGQQRGQQGGQQTSGLSVNV